MKQTRVYSLDLLRIICCYMVIAIHVFMSFRDFRGDICNSILFMESFTRCCVPIFFMLTGFFMFQREKTVKQIICYMGKRIIFPTFVLLVLIQIFASWFYSEETFWGCLKGIRKDDIKAICMMLFTWKMPEPNFWLWYITVLVQIYFFYPLLKYICVDKKEENLIRRGYLVFCSASTMVLPTMKRLGTSSLEEIFIYTPLPFYAFVYLLVGYELYLLYQKKSQYLNGIVGLVIYIVGAILTYWLTIYIDIAADEEFSHLFFNYEMLNVALTAIGLFIFFLGFPEFKIVKVNKLISKISGRTFAIYLIHYPIILKLQSLKVNSILVDQFGVEIGCCVFVAVVFIVALLISSGVHFMKEFIYNDWIKRGRFLCKRK